MHLTQHELCARKTELAVEVKFYLDFHRVARPWRRTLTNGNDVKDVFPLTNGSDVKDVFPLTNGSDVKDVFPLTNGSDVKDVFPRCRSCP